MASSVRKKWAKIRPLQAEGLLPAVRALPHGVFEVAPQLPEHVVRVGDVAGQPVGAGLGQVGRGDRGILVLVVPFIEQLQADAGVKQLPKSIGVGLNLLSEVGQRLRTHSQGIEDAE